MNIGDKIRVVNDHDLWTSGHGLERDTILTVVEEDKDYNSRINPDKLTIEIGAIMEFPNDFEKVEDGYFSSEITSEQTVRSDNQVAGDWSLRLNSGGFAGMGVGLGLIGEQCPETIIPVERAKELGVYRPKLEDRKIGKVGMHFVDDGFPNALREIAKVMDWAAEVKGYKLHDWKNLPNAQLAFPSAGYRHRNDNSVQKALGLSAMERVDHESALLHKAHEAFNVLAELELILTGVIK